MRSGYNPNPPSPEHYETYYNTRITRWFSQRGDQWRAACVLHAGDGDSLAVHIPTGRWRCFSRCDAGGNVFEFEKRFSGCDFPQAVQNFCRITGYIAGADPDSGLVVAVYDYTDL